MKNELQREQGKSSMGRGKPKEPDFQKQEWLRECKERTKNKPFLSHIEYLDIAIKLGYRKEEQ